VNPQEVLVRNRREFLQISLASSALPLVAGEQRERVRVRGVVVEMSSPLALAFRAAAVELGLEAHGINDDVTDLWYHKLDRQWRTAPAALAGITLSTSLFCLETFARDYGMRVWFRALHDKTADGREWGPAFARFAAAVPLAESSELPQKIMETATLPAEEPGPMVSWIIAPRGVF
jgi:hypothetical protein